MQRGNDLSDVIELSRTGKRVAKSWHKTKWKKRNRTENSSSNEEVFLLFSVFIYTCSIYLYHGSAGRHKAVFYTHTHTHIPSGYRLLLVASSFDSLSLFSRHNNNKKKIEKNHSSSQKRERERTVVMHEASGRIYDQTRRSLPFNATPTRNEILNFSEFKRSLWGEKKEEKKKTTKEDKKKNFPFHYYGECHWSSCFFFSGDCCVNRPN